MVLRLNDVGVERRTLNSRMICSWFGKLSAGCPLHRDGQRSHNFEVSYRRAEGLVLQPGVELILSGGLQVDLALGV